MTAWRRCVATLAVAGLSACASAPPLPAPIARGDFSMSGRVLVRQAERADVLRLHWSHHGESDEVRLETPLGQTIAELSMGPAMARARLGDGREFEAPDDAALADQVIGSPLPLRRFAGWLHAEPGLAASGIERDAAGRVLAMSDAGWQLSYAGHGDVVSLDGPSLIEAKREDVLVRIKIETWVRGGVE